MPSFVEILPFEGVGEIRFGMTIQEVKARTRNLALRVNGRMHPAQIGAFVDFDDDGRSEGIEFTGLPGEPAGVLSGVALRGTLVELGDSLTRRRWDRERGLGVSSDTIFVLKAGVTLWTEDLEGQVQAIGVWRRGYRAGASATSGVP